MGLATSRNCLVDVYLWKFQKRDNALHKLPANVDREIRRLMDSDPMTLTRDNMKFRVSSNPFHISAESKLTKM